MNVGNCTGQPTTALDTNASNLPIVLNQLSTTNSYRFQRLVGLVRAILPDIKSVTAKETAQGVYQIQIWPIDPDSEREDLSLPLSECGTGVGQILAILYVVVTSESPKVIIIDEPQSFLHPGALRKLIDILRYEQKHEHEHQYIFSSHSPQIIASAAPTAFHFVTKIEMESHVQRMDADDVAHQRELLADLGVTMADVLSAENIIWVEGQTEAEAFPLILSSFETSDKQRLNRLLGTAILPVVATGDLEGTNKERVADIYRRLSAGSALIPPALAFVLDSDDRTDSRKLEFATKLGLERPAIGIQWIHKSPTIHAKHRVCKP